MAPAKVKSSAVDTSRRQKRRSGIARPATMLFGVLLVLYHVNGDFLIGNDAKPNVYLAPTLLSRGRLTFTPEDSPFMFLWKLSAPPSELVVNFDRWDTRVVTAATGNFRLPDSANLRALYAEGRLTLLQHKYYIVPTTTPGHYVTTFGPGSGLAALPVYSLLKVGVGGDLMSSPRALWYGGKFTASVLVAGSAVFTFLTALGYVKVGQALLIAAAYGAGTCVWSISSQSLWAHGANEFCLAMGAYYFSRLDERRHAAWLSGLAFAAAVACRAPSALMPLAVGAYLAARSLVAFVRRQAVAEQARPAVEFFLGALPIAALLALHNGLLLGAPWRFGHTNIDGSLVAVKTGIEEGGLWQTPPWVGAAGLLLSPSRGLLIYSPFLVFAFWGGIRAWRDQRYCFLRPLSLGMVSLWLVAFCWYDWWGGWCFGYRPLVDTMPMLVLLLIPVMDAITRSLLLRTAFVLLLAWSAGVQVVGAFAYNSNDWNAPLMGFELSVPGERQPIVVLSSDRAKELMQRRRATLLRQFATDSDRHGDSDRPENRGRLWSIADSEIVFYISNFAQCRQRKQEMIKGWLANPAVP